MKFTTSVRLVSLALLAATSMLATAGGARPYTQQEFDQLTRSGKPVVLDISATWCPTCKAQEPILRELLQQQAYKEVNLLSIDFDKDKTVLRKFGVSTQSTLVAFDGTREVARSVGDTSREGIEQLIRKSIH